MDAINSPGRDPLMIIDLSRSLINSVIPPWTLILSMVLGGIVLLVEIFLHVPIVFNWRHARNLHFTTIVSAVATCFFLFVASLNTTSAISASIATITTVSLQVVEAERGILLESFLWTACGIWLLVFVFLTWLRWWEILERREQKMKAKKFQEDRKKKAEEDKKRRMVPLNPKDAASQQMAAAQM
jgi:hypothetical protein